MYLPWEYLKGNFRDCDVSLSNTDLRRLEALALEHIHYGDSEGRVEAMQELLKAHLARSEAESQ